jgi:mannose-1-phosphate guanylyltransferase
MAEKKLRTNPNQTKPIVLIMAGGKGERFWPRSRISNPKQLQKVYSDRTLLEATFLRARSITDANRIFVGCNAELKRAILKTHKMIPASQFVVEPEGRNTAPIIALAALQFEKKFPGATHVVLSADHYIAPPEKFQSTLKTALAAAAAGWLVTLGVRPNRPEIGYGYIKAGAKMKGSGAHAIDSFVEKPDLERAKSYLGAGDYFWNSGIFIWPGRLILEEFERYAPEILAPLVGAGASAARLKQVFPKIPSTPVDIAILEKSQRIAMCPAEFAWDDVGSWLSLERIVPPGEGGNRTVSRRKKPALLASLSSRNNLVVADKELVALLGVDDLIVVEEPDGLFISRRDQIDRIKELLAELRKNPSLQKYLK